MCLEDYSLYCPGLAPSSPNHRDLLVSVLKKAVGSTVVPTLRYRDLPAAVDWLSVAFGFTAHHLTHDNAGVVVSAQLVRGRGMVMLAPVGGSVFDELMKQPDEIGGAETQSCYFIVEDADAHFAQATRHGAEIVLELQNFEHGGRGYLCRDPEGHLWSFGTFSPWSQGAAAHLLADFPRLTPKTLGISAAAIVAVLVAGTAYSMSWGESGPSEGPSARPSAIALFKERGARIAAQREAAQLRRDKEAAELDEDKLQEQLAHASGAREAADSARASSEGSIRKLSAQIEQLKADHSAAEKSIRRLVARGIQERRVRERSRRRAADQLNQALSLERAAKQRSEKTTADLREQLQRENAARTSSERAHSETIDELAKERDARKKLDASLADAVSQLKKVQEARDLEASSPSAPPAPVPAKRPDRSK